HRRRHYAAGSEWPERMDGLCCRGRYQRRDAEGAVPGRKDNERRHGGSGNGLVQLYSGPDRGGLGLVEDEVDVNKKGTQIGRANPGWVGMAADGYFLAGAFSSL